MIRRTSSPKVQEQQDLSSIKHGSMESENVGPRFEVRRTKSGPGYAGHANAYKIDVSLLTSLVACECIVYLLSCLLHLNDNSNLALHRSKIT